jgi:hypothetical protein
MVVATSIPALPKAPIRSIFRTPHELRLVVGRQQSSWHGAKNIAGIEPALGEKSSDGG